MLTEQPVHSCQWHEDLPWKEMKKMLEEVQEGLPELKDLVEGGPDGSDMQKFETAVEEGIKLATAISTIREQQQTVEHFIAAQQKQLAHLNHAVDEASTKEAALTPKVSTLLQQHGVLTVELMELKQSVRRACADVEKANADVTKARADLEEAKHQRADLAARMEALIEKEEHIRNADNKLAEAQQKMQFEKQDLVELKAKLHEEEDRLQSNTRTIKKQEESFSAKDNRLQEQQKLLTMRNSDLDNEASELASKIQKQSQDLATLRIREQCLAKGEEKLVALSIKQNEDQTRLSNHILHFASLTDLLSSAFQSLLSVSATPIAVRLSQDPLKLSEQSELLVKAMTKEVERLQVAETRLQDQLCKERQQSEAQANILGEKLLQAKSGFYELEQSCSQYQMENRDLKNSMRELRESEQESQLKLMKVSSEKERAEEAVKRWELGATLNKRQLDELSIEFEDSKRRATDLEMQNIRLSGSVSDYEVLVLDGNILKTKLEAQAKRTTKAETLYFQVVKEGEPTG